MEQAGAGPEALQLAVCHPGQADSPVLEFQGLRRQSQLGPSFALGSGGKALAWFT